MNVDPEYNLQTRTKANILLTSASNPVFLVCLKIISRYSAQLEPVTNKLQGVSVDLLSVKQHIDQLLTIFANDRENSEDIFSLIFKEVEEMAQISDIEIKIPRITGRQTHRSNVPATSAEQYFRLNIFIPYLDSLITSLKSRFSEDSSIGFSLSRLHPKITRNNVFLKSDQIKNITEKYGLENFEAEYTTWVATWKIKEVSENVDFSELLSNDCEFYPSIQKGLKIFLTLPPTSCSIERSFSTLRRVKTWLRSTISENRLSGLCMMSVHRTMVENKKDEIISSVIDIFGSDRRNLKFLFS